MDNNITDDQRLFKPEGQKILIIIAYSAHYSVINISLNFS